MKRGVENGRLRYIGKLCQGCPNPGQVDRVVKRGKACAAFNGLEHIAINEYGLMEGLTTMNDPVTYGRGSRCHQSQVPESRDQCI